MDRRGSQGRRSRRTGSKSARSAGRRQARRESAPSTTACATGASPASATGAARSPSSTARTCGVVPVPRGGPTRRAARRCQRSTKPGNPLDRHPTWKPCGLPEMRQARSRTRDRHHGHLRRLVLVFRTVLRTPCDGYSRPTVDAVRLLAAGRSVYRRRRARHPAFALFALFHARLAPDRITWHAG